MVTYAPQMPSIWAPRHGQRLNLKSLEKRIFMSKHVLDESPGSYFTCRIDNVEIIEPEYREIYTTRFI